MSIPPEAYKPEEVELQDMRPTRDDDSDLNAPLIADRQQHVAPAPSLNSSGNAFVWSLTVAACISGLLFGYDTGVISSTLVSIGTDLSQRPLTTLDKGLITSCTSLFALVASPIAGVLADRVGRKNIILFADGLFTIGALWQALTSSVWGMIFGRSIVGLAIGGASLIVPLYISELAPSHLRGRLVTVSLLFITGGQVIAYLVGWAFSTMSSGWR
jgi:MFS transporter, SP family, solute carrier family 2 (myo-inositol transporter), member 13